MADKWIQGADLKEGAFTRQARRAGMTVKEFAAHVIAHPDQYDPTTLKRAHLAQTFSKMSKGA